MILQVLSCHPEIERSVVADEILVGVLLNELGNSTGMNEICAALIAVNRSQGHPGYLPILDNGRFRVIRDREVWQLLAKARFFNSHGNPYSSGRSIRSAV